MMDSNGLYDIYATWHMPFWQTQWFFWSVVTCIILLCILLAVLIYHSYKKKTKTAATPWHTALTKIHRLQKKTYTTKEEGKHCFLVLTTTMKHYLHERYGYPIAQATDEEAAQYLEKQNLAANTKKELQNILRAGTLIKFANEQAVNEELHEQLTNARNIIEKTVPQKNN